MELVSPSDGWPTIREDDRRLHLAISTGCHFFIRLQSTIVSGGMHLRGQLQVCPESQMRCITIHPLSTRHNLTEEDDRDGGAWRRAR